ncbi:hypothetical protein HL42_6577 [Trichophyton rubrum]|nr:hypothetical protein HL42_6577 [Trichophyton rubrum]
MAKRQPPTIAKTTSPGRRRQRTTAAAADDDDDSNSDEQESLARAAAWPPDGKVDFVRLRLPSRTGRKPLRCHHVAAAAFAELRLFVSSVSLKQKANAAPFRFVFVAGRSQSAVRSLAGKQDKQAALTASVLVLSAPAGPPDPHSIFPPPLSLRLLEPDLPQSLSIPKQSFACTVNRSSGSSESPLSERPPRERHTYTPTYRTHVKLLAHFCFGNSLILLLPQKSKYTHSHRFPRH